MDKLINTIMAELEPIANGESETGNYWINDNYNVFAFHEDNGDGDEWISIKLEQYDDNEECINCELYFADTDDMSITGLESAVLTITSWYMNNINIEMRQTLVNIDDKLLCKKQLSDDTDEHKIDFIIDEMYYISAFEDDGIYITAEDGSNIWFESEQEILEYFDIV